MEGAPSFGSSVELPTDLDRITSRLEQERFHPVETFDGEPCEIESVVYPDWYTDGTRLLSALEGHRASDEELQAIAEEMGIDLRTVLGRQDTEVEGPEVAIKSGRSLGPERGKG